VLTRENLHAVKNAHIAQQPFHCDCDLHFSFWAH